MWTATTVLETVQIFIDLTCSVATHYGVTAKPKSYIGFICESKETHLKKANQFWFANINATERIFVVN